MNMLPLPFNNSEPSFKDLIEEQTDVFQISQLDIIDSLESIKKIQKDTFDISFKMYNLQEEQFELAKSQLFDQKEFMDEQRRALNNSRTNFGGDTSSNNNETVSQLPGGAGGGSNGMMGSALGMAADRILSRGRPDPRPGTRPGTRPGPGSGPGSGPRPSPRPGGFLKSGLKGFLKGGPMAVATSLIIDFAGEAALDIIADGVEDPEAKAKVRSIGETALKGISIAAAFAIGGPYVGMAVAVVEGIDLLNKKMDTETKRIKDLTDPLKTPEEKAREAGISYDLPGMEEEKASITGGYEAVGKIEDRNMRNVLKIEAMNSRAINALGKVDKSVIAEKEQLTLARLLKHKENIDNGTIKSDSARALGSVATSMAVALKDYPGNPRITNTVKDIIDLVDSKGGDKESFIRQISSKLDDTVVGGGEERRLAVEQLMTPIYQDRKIEPPKAPSTSVTDEIQIPNRKIEPPKAPSTSVTQVDEPPKAPSTSTDVPNGTDNTSTSVPGRVQPAWARRAQAELEEKSARRKAADTNKDGELSRAELEAANAKVQPLLPGGAAQLDAAGKLNTSTDVSNGTDNTSTNVPNGTDNTSTNVSDRMDAYDAKLLALLESGQEITGEMIQDLLMEHFGRNVPNGTNKMDPYERELARLAGQPLPTVPKMDPYERELARLAGQPLPTVPTVPKMDPYERELARLAGQTALPRNVSNGNNNTSVTQLESGKGGEIPNSVTQVGSDSNFGSIAARFESNGKPGTISTGKGDHGGKSYGMFQLASRGGASNNEVEKFLNESGYSEKFNGMKVGSSEFDAQWKKLAKEDSGFGEAQSSYAKKSYYDPQMKNLQRSGIDLSGKGRSVQESIMSTANQYGPNTDLIREALKGKDPTNMTDKEIVNAIQDYKADTVDTRFRSSSKNDREGVARRIERERTALLNFPDDKTAKQLMEGPLEGSGNSGNKNAAPPVIVDGRTFNNNSSTSAPASPSRPIEVAAINIQQKFSDYSTLSGYNG